MSDEQLSMEPEPWWGDSEGKYAPRARMTQEEIGETLADIAALGGTKWDGARCAVEARYLLRIIAEGSHRA